jgi:nitrous oxide reductase
MEDRTLTRRGFIKASAMLGAVATMGIGAANSLVEADEAFADQAGHT